MTPLDSLRADFPILHQRVAGEPLVYFDNAASSQKPRQVIDALVRYYEQDNANVHRGLHELSNRATAKFEAARTTLARFLGAGSEHEVIFTRGTTESINLVAQVMAARWSTEDAVVVSGMEHHSNLVPWQMAAQRSGASLWHVPVLDDGSLDLAVLQQHLDTGRVRLVSCVHVSNSLGSINPVAEICAMARRAGALSLIDGAQAVGHFPVDVSALGCDLYAFSGHKMCGPTGIGVLWGRSQVLAQMAPWQGGGEMIDSVTLDRSTYKEAPARFEAGTPDIAGVIGLGAAVDYLQTIGLERIEAHGKELTQMAVAGLVQLPGLRLLGPAAGQPRGALASFTLDCAHTHDLVEFANTRGLALRGGHHCTQPLMKRFKAAGSSRASFYFYNTVQEVESMLRILREAIAFFS
jgi:cysteine desulfurase/selenocysteine lyase